MFPGLFREKNRKCDVLCNGILTSMRIDAVVRVLSFVICMLLLVWFVYTNEIAET